MIDLLSALPGDMLLQLVRQRREDIRTDFERCQLGGDGSLSRATAAVGGYAWRRLRAFARAIRGERDVVATGANVP